MGVREAFVARFGENDAAAIESAAEGHIASDVFGTHSSDDRGNDPFRYLFLTAIGFDCVARFRDAHGIAASEADLRDWAVSEGHLGEHDGDVPDYLALVSGAYDG